MSKAAALARAFHGRKNIQVKTFTRNIRYRKEQAELGQLIDIEIRQLKVYQDGIDDKFDTATMIFWNLDEEGNPSKSVLANLPIICSEPSGNQYYLNSKHGIGASCLGGFDFDSGEVKKDFIVIGYVEAVTYWTDKHHLEGPDYQKDGCPYRHPLGEEGGTLPLLVYDALNQSLMWVGGSYTTIPEGIKN